LSARVKRGRYRAVTTVLVSSLLLCCGFLSYVALPKTLPRAIAEDQARLVSSEFGGLVPVNDITALAVESDAHEQVVKLSYTSAEQNYQFFATAKIDAQEAGALWLNDGGITKDTAPSAFYTAGHTEVPVVFQTADLEHIVIKSSTSARVELIIFAEVNARFRDVTGPGGVKVVHAASMTGDYIDKDGQKEQRVPSQDLEATTSDYDQCAANSPVQCRPTETDVAGLLGIVARAHNSGGVANSFTPTAAANSSIYSLDVLGRSEVPVRKATDPQPVRNVYLSVLAGEDDLEFEGGVVVRAGKSALVLAAVDEFGRVHFKTSGTPQISVVGFVRDVDYTSAFYTVAGGENGQSKTVEHTSPFKDGDTEDEGDPEPEPEPGAQNNSGDEATSSSISLDIPDRINHSRTPQVTLWGTYTGDAKLISVYAGQERIGTATVNVQAHTWQIRSIVGEGKATISAQILTQSGDTAIASKQVSVQLEAQDDETVLDNLPTSDTYILPDSVASRVTLYYQNTMTLTSPSPILIPRVDAQGTPVRDPSSGKQYLHQIAVGDIITSASVEGKIPAGMNKRVVAIEPMVSKTVVTFVDAELDDTFLAINTSQEQIVPQSQLQKMNITQELEIATQNQTPQLVSTQYDDASTHSTNNQISGDIAPAVKYPINGADYSDKDTVTDQQIIQQNQDIVNLNPQLIDFDVAPTLNICAETTALSEPEAPKESPGKAPNFLSGSVKACINLSAGIGFYIDIKITVKWKWGFIPTGISAYFDAGFKAFYSAKFSATGNVTIGYQWNFPPIKITQIFFNFVAGIIPVSISGSVECITSFRISITITGSIEIDLGKGSFVTGWSTQRHTYTDKSKTKPKTTSASAGAQLAFTPSIKLVFTLLLYEALQLIQLTAELGLPFEISFTFTWVFKDCPKELGTEEQSLTVEQQTQNAIENNSFKKENLLNESTGIPPPEEETNSQKHRVKSLDLVPQSEDGICSDVSLEIEFGLDLELSITLWGGLKFLKWKIFGFSVTFMLFDLKLLNFKFEFELEPDVKGSPQVPSPPAMPATYSSDGALFAWGKNDTGQLGAGTTDTNRHDSPSVVEDLATVTKVVTLGDTAYALSDTGSIFTWGGGTNLDPQKLQLDDESPLSGVKDIVSDGTSTGYALTKNGLVYKWGATTPASQVPLLSQITQIGAGSDTLYALRADNRMWYLGKDVYNNTSVTTPSILFADDYLLQNNFNVCQIAAGTDSLYLSLKPTNLGPTDAKRGKCTTLFAMGKQTSGQLGNGTDSSATAKNTSVNIGDKMVVDLSAQGNSVLAVIATPPTEVGGDSGEGTVLGWGANANGQLGNSSISATSEPTAVDLPSGLKDVYKVSLSANYSLLMLTDGDVLFTGTNTSYTAMDSTKAATAKQETPVKLPLSHIGGIRAGTSASYAIVKSLTGDDATGTPHKFNTTTNQFDSISGLTESDYSRVVSTADGRVITLEKDGTIKLDGTKVNLTDTASAKIEQVQHIGLAHISGAEKLYIQNSAGQLYTVQIPAGSFTTLAATILQQDSCREANVQSLVQDIWVGETFMVGVCGYKGDPGPTGDDLAETKYITDGLDEPGITAVTGLFENDAYTEPNASDNFAKLVPFKEGTTFHLLNIAKSGKLYEDGVELTLFNTLGEKFVTATVDEVNGKIYAVTSNNEAVYEDTSTTVKYVDDISVLNVFATNGAVFDVEKTPSSKVVPDTSDVNGTLYNWGQTTDQGHLLSPTTPEAVESQSVRQVVANETANYALLTNGRVRSWGGNDFGELGIGSTSNIHDVYCDVSTLQNVVVLYAQGHTAWALTDNGQIYTWGEDAQSYFPRLSTNLTPSNQLAISHTGIYSLRANGSVAFTSNFLDLSTFSRVDGLHGAKQISVYTDSLSRDHIVYVDADGNVKDYNRHTGTATSVYTPANSTSGVKAVRVEAAWQPIEAVYLVQTEDNSLYSTGDNSNFIAQPRGDNAGTQLIAPVMGISPGVVKDFQISGQSAALVTNDNRVYTWGNNDSGQLGVGDTDAHHGLSKMPNVTGSQALGKGTDRTFLIGDLEDPTPKAGAVFAWGSNANGKLGTTSGATTITTPVEVAAYASVDENGAAVEAELNAVKVVSNGESTLALTDAGNVVGWGLNDKWQLGTQDSGSGGYLPPTMISGLNKVVDIAIGADAGYAVRKDGTVVAWGSNKFGQLGINSTTITQGLPRFVWGVYNAKKVAAGEHTAYLALMDGTVVAFGDGRDGRLGLGMHAYDEQNKIKPYKVEGLVSVRDIAATSSGAFALQSSGLVYSWGKSVQGEIGQGSKDGITYSPTQVTAADPAQTPRFSQIDASATNVLLKDTTGRLYGLGDNSYNQIPVVEGLGGNLQWYGKLQQFTSINSAFSAGAKTTYLNYSTSILTLGGTGYVSGIAPTTDPTTVDFATNGEMYSVVTRGGLETASNYVISTAAPSSAGGSLSNIWVYGNNTTSGGNTAAFSAIDTNACPPSSGNQGVKPCLVQMDEESMGLGRTGTQVAVSAQSYIALMNDGTVLRPGDPPNNTFVEPVQAPSPAQAQTNTCSVHLCNIVSVAATDAYFYALSSTGDLFKFSASSAATPVKIGTALSLSIPVFGSDPPTSNSVAPNILTASGANVMAVYKGDAGQPTGVITATDTSAPVSVMVSEDGVENGWAGPNAFYAFGQNEAGNDVVFAWGNNGSCTLGITSPCNTSQTETSPTEAAQINNQISEVDQMVFSNKAAFILDTNGLIWGFGKGDNGELAGGEASAAALSGNATATPALLFGEADSVSTIVGGKYSGAAFSTTSAGVTTAYTWGNATVPAGQNCSILAHNQSACTTFTGTGDALVRSSSLGAQGLSGAIGITDLKMSRTYDFAAAVGGTTTAPAIGQSQTSWEYQIGQKFAIPLNITAVPGIESMPVVESKEKNGAGQLVSVDPSVYGLKVSCDSNAGAYSNCQITTADLAAGQYAKIGAVQITITAANMVGEASKTFQISVVGAVPTISLLSTQISADVGDTVNIPISVSGTPPPTVNDITVTPEIPGLSVVESADTTTYMLSGTISAPVTNQVSVVKVSTLAGSASVNLAVNATLEHKLNIPCTNNSAVVNDGRPCVISVNSATNAYFDFQTWGADATSEVVIAPGSAAQDAYNQASGVSVVPVPLSDLGLSLTGAPGADSKWILTSGGLPIAQAAPHLNYGHFPFTATFGTSKYNFWIDYLDTAPSVYALDSSTFTASVGQTLSAQFGVNSAPTANITIDRQDSTCEAPPWMSLGTVLAGSGTLNPTQIHTITADSLPEERRGEYCVKISAVQSYLNSAGQTITRSALQNFTVDIVGTVPTLALAPAAKTIVDINQRLENLEIPVAVTGNPIPQVQITSTDNDFIELDDGPTREGDLTAAGRFWYIYANHASINQTALGDHIAELQASNMLGQSPVLTVPFTVYKSITMNPDTSGTIQQIRSNFDIPLNISGVPAPTTVEMFPGQQYPQWALDSGAEIAKTDVGDGQFVYNLKTERQVDDVIDQAVPIRVTQIVAGQTLVTERTVNLRTVAAQKPQIYLPSTLEYNAGQTFSYPFAQTGDPCQGLSLSPGAPAWVLLSHDGLSECSGWKLTGTVPSNISNRQEFIVSIKEDSEQEQVGQVQVGIDPIDIQMHIPSSYALTVGRAVDIDLGFTGEAPTNVYFTPDTTIPDPPGLSIIQTDDQRWHIVGTPLVSGTYPTIVYAVTDFPNINTNQSVLFNIIDSSLPTKLHINGPSSVEQLQYAAWGLNMTGNCMGLPVTDDIQAELDYLNLQITGSCGTHDLEISGQISIHAAPGQYTLDFGDLGMVAFFVYASNYPPTWTSRSDYAFTQYSFASIDLGLQDLSCSSGSLTFDDATSTFPPGMYIAGTCLDPYGYRFEGIPTTPGIYSVTLIASDGDYSYTKALTITINGIQTTPHIADQLSNDEVATQGGFLSIPVPVSGMPAPEVSILAVSSGAPPVKIVSYTNGNTYLQAAIPPYQTVGTYYVTLQATNSSGVDTKVYSFSISAPSTPPVFDLTTTHFYAPLGERFDIDIPVHADPTPVVTYAITSGGDTISQDSLTSSLNLSKLTADAVKVGKATVEVTATNHPNTSPDAVSEKITLTLETVPTDYAFYNHAKYFTTINDRTEIDLQLKGSPSAESVQATNLPAGLSVERRTTTAYIDQTPQVVYNYFLTGTPTQLGEFQVGLTALDSQQKTLATSQLILKVNPTVHKINLPQHNTVTFGEVASLPLDITGSPCADAVTVTGLPDGLTLEGSCPANNWSITGTPAVVGSFPVAISAAVAGADTTAEATGTAVIEVVPSAVALELGQSEMTVTLGEGFNLPVYVSGFSHYTLTAQGLPGGVSVVGANTNQPMLIGTPAALGDYHIILTATDTADPSVTTTVLFTLFVRPWAPSLNLPATLDYTLNEQVYTLLHASGNPCPGVTMLDALPPGLNFAGASCSDDPYRIEGIPTRIGSSVVRFQIDSDSEPETAVQITVHGAQPNIGIADDIYTVHSKQFAFDLQVTGDPDPTVTINGPSWVTLLDGKITGSAPAIGNYPLTLTATSAAGSVSKTVVLHVAGELPSFGLSTTQNLTLNRFTHINLGLVGDPAPEAVIVSGALPEGLTMSRGYIEGTPTALGESSVSLLASNSAGTATITVDFLVFSEDIAFNIGSTFSITAQEFERINLGLPALSTVEVTAQGLPDGLSLYQDDDFVWWIQGTTDQLGPFTVDLQATNTDGAHPSFGKSATKQIVVTVHANEQGMIVSGDTTYLESQPVKIDITVSGDPLPVLSVNGTPPPGLQLSGSGQKYQINGTITTAGVYTLDLVLDNGITQMHKSLTITVTEGAPVFSVDDVLYLQVGAQNKIDLGLVGATLTEVFAEDLPNNLKLVQHGAKYFIEGIAYTAGDYHAKVVAKNDATAEVKNLELIVSDDELSADVKGVYNVTATKFFSIPLNIASVTPAVVQATQALPEGTHITGQWGVSPFRLEGRLDAVGTYPVSLSVTNASTSLPFGFDIVVHPATPAFPGLPTTLHFTDGKYISYNLGATGDPTPVVTITSGALPAGLTLEGGYIKGTPTVSGTYTITLQASNGVGDTVTQTLVLEVSDEEAAIHLGSTAYEFPPGANINIPLNVTGDPSPQVRAFSLPSGLTLSGNSALGYFITGQIIDPGFYPFEVVASNDSGSQTARGSIKILGEHILFGGLNSFTVVAGNLVAVDLGVVSSPWADLSITAGALPSGLELDTSTGVIKGRTEQVGSFEVEITAVQGTHTVTSAVEITVVSADLAILAPGAVALTAGQFFDYDLEIAGVPKPTVAVTNGSLPQGLALNLTNNHIYGVPTSVGAFTFEITASTPDKNTTKEFTFSIESTAARLHTEAEYAVHIDQFVNIDLGVTGAPLPAVEIVQGELPAGLELKMVSNPAPLLLPLSATTATLDSSLPLQTSSTPHWYLTGVPQDAQGDYSAQLSAQNAGSTASSQVVLHLSGSAPEVKDIEQVSAHQLSYIEIPIEVEGSPAPDITAQFTSTDVQQAQEPTPAPQAQSQTLAQAQSQRSPTQAQPSASSLPQGLKLTYEDGIYKVAGTLKAPPGMYEITLDAVSSAGVHANTFTLEVLEPKARPAPAPDISDTGLDTSAPALLLLLLLTLAGAASCMARAIFSSPKEKGGSDG
jgi:alpha-tubulin suppressor-like RCC1 family protein